MRLTSPNLVLDDDVLTWVVDHLPHLYVKTREERITLEERWLHFWKMWSVELDRPSYTGRSQVYVAAARNAIETWVTALMAGVFPVSDWFKVIPVQHVTGQTQADRWTALQKNFLTTEMQLEEEMPLFFRQLLTYGTAVLRHVWEEDEEPRRFWERQLKDAPLDTDAEEARFREETEPDDDDPLSFSRDDGSVVRLVEKLVKTKCGPSARTVDLFHFHVAPLSARSIARATLAFEDMEVPIAHLKDMHTRRIDPEQPDFGRVYDHPEWDTILAESGKVPDEMLQSLRERWQRLGIEFDANKAFPGGLDRKGHVQLTESFWRGTIPDARMENGKLYGNRDWLVTWVNGVWPVRIQANPHYAQERPWQEARLFRTVNMFYAQGVMDAVASIQYLLNDIGNLTLDNLTMALNPVVTIDEDLVTNMESLQWAPGAKWFVQKDGVNVLNLPTQAQLGMATMNMMQGFIQDFSNASAANQGVPPQRGRGRVAQTATGYAQLQATGSQAFEAVNKAIERQLMVPLLERNYHFAEQFMTAKQVIQRLGAQGAGLVTEEIGFEDIFGSYRYEWRGSVGMRERTALLSGLQNLPQMLQLLGPQVQQAFDGVEFVKLMLADGYNVPWYDRIFKTPGDEPTIAPKLEADILAAHRAVEVHPADDDAAHMQDHLLRLAQDPRFLSDPIARELMLAHIEQQQMQLEQKQQAAQQRQIMQVMQALMGGGQEQGPPQNGMGSLPAPQEPQAPTDQMADQARAQQF